MIFHSTKLFQKGIHTPVYVCVCMYTMVSSFVALGGGHPASVSLKLYQTDTWVIGDLRTHNTHVISIQWSLYICTSTQIYIYIYIYIERERERSWTIKCVKWKGQKGSNESNKDTGMISFAHVWSLWLLVRTWWRHQMETKSALLALCAGNSQISGEFPSQRPVTRSFGVFFMCVWTNGWAKCLNTSHRAHYDVTIMRSLLAKVLSATKRIYSMRQMTKPKGNDMLTLIWF